MSERHVSHRRAKGDVEGQQVIDGLPFQAHARGHRLRAVQWVAAAGKRDIQRCVALGNGARGAVLQHLAESEVFEKITALLLGHRA